MRHHVVHRFRLGADEGAPSVVLDGNIGTAQQGFAQVSQRLLGCIFIT